MINKTSLLWWRLKEGGQRSQCYSVLMSWDDFVTNLQVKSCFNFLFCLLCAGILLPYPSDNLVLDVVLLLLFLGLETLRIFYGENLTDHLLNCTSRYSWCTVVIVQRMQLFLSVEMAAAVMWHRKETRDDIIDDLIDDSWWCVVGQVGRGTCVSALWPRACRSSSWSPVWRWLFTTCCCRPSFCGWSSSSAPSCSASMASSSCLDFSLCPPSPGDLIVWCVWAGGFVENLNLLKYMWKITLCVPFYVFLVGPKFTETSWLHLKQSSRADQHRMENVQTPRCK